VIPLSNSTDSCEYTPLSLPADRHRSFESTLVVLPILWALIGTPILHAQSSPTEYQVKAAYLYNFGKFVEWPINATASEGSFNICVLGQDPFGPTLAATITGESIKGKNVLLKRIPRVQDAVGCHILFISSSEEVRLKEILAALDKTSVLTVSDMPQFTRRGGMIQFVMEANKVRFEVSLTSAERTGLTLSSQLLKVAISVRGNS
jgi:YfiR/HmsC-like